MLFVVAMREVCFIMCLGGKYICTLENGVFTVNSKKRTDSAAAACRNLINSIRQRGFNIPAVIMHQVNALPHHDDYQKKWPCPECCIPEQIW